MRREAPVNSQLKERTQKEDFTRPNSSVILTNQGGGILTFQQTTGEDDVCLYVARCRGGVIKTTPLRRTFPSFFQHERSSASPNTEFAWCASQCFFSVFFCFLFYSLVETPVVGESKGNGGMALGRIVPDSNTPPNLFLNFFSFHTLVTGTRPTLKKVSNGRSAHPRPPPLSQGHPLEDP